MNHPTALVGSLPEHREYRMEGCAVYGVFGLAPDRVRVHAEALLEAYVTVDAGIHHVTTVGARTWLMKGCHVGHDAFIGADCEFAPHCSVGGHVRIGDRVRVGQAAVFRPFVTVGDDARIGAGAVVVKDVPAGEVWAGNPARRLRAPATGVVLTALEEQGWDEFASHLERRDRETDEEIWNDWFERSRA